MQPLGVVEHVHHQVLDPPQAAQISGKVARPHAVGRGADPIDGDDVTDGIGEPVYGFIPAVTMDCKFDKQGVVNFRNGVALVNKTIDQ